VLGVLLRFVLATQATHAANSARGSVQWARGDCSGPELALPWSLARTPATKNWMMYSRRSDVSIVPDKVTAILPVLVAPWPCTSVVRSITPTKFVLAIRRVYETCSPETEHQHDDLYGKLEDVEGGHVALHAVKE
jgi:hypothetical protein